MYLFIWLHWVLVTACGVFSCGMWDLVPWLGIEPRPPALGPPGKSHLCDVSWGTKALNFNGNTIIHLSLQFAPLVLVWDLLPHCVLWSDLCHLGPVQLEVILCLCRGPVLFRPHTLHWRAPSPRGSVVGPSVVRFPWTVGICLSSESSAHDQGTISSYTGFSFDVV